MGIYGQVSRAGKKFKGALTMLIKLGKQAIKFKPNINPKNQHNKLHITLKCKQLDQMSN